MQVQSLPNAWFSGRLGLADPDPEVFPRVSPELELRVGSLALRPAQPHAFIYLTHIAFSYLFVSLALRPARPRAHVSVALSSTSTADR